MELVQQSWYAPWSQNCQCKLTINGTEGHSSNKKSS